ncbi:alpha/beta hydrolase [Roseomonas sp. F4]
MTRVVEFGAPLHRARAAVLMFHGRGGDAEGMLSLAEALTQPDLAWLAPEAAGRSWYPHDFLAPVERNEPRLSAALGTVTSLLQRLADAGFPPARVALLGFSQGACLALEYAARHAQRYAAVIGLSGGLIGPDGTARACTGSLHNSPIFLGCSDADPHIPLARVQETARTLRALGGAVILRIHPGMGHGINEDEIRQVGQILSCIGAPEATA